jgi:hypothetical protein
MKEITILWSLALIGILFLVLTLILQSNKSIPFSISRPALEVKEPFEDDSPKKVIGIQEDALTAGDAELNEVSKPYHLLEENSRRETTLNKVGSESCYENDFQKEIQKTGSYNQLTNNYRRASPDSCNTYLQEFVTSFYNAELK